MPVRDKKPLRKAKRREKAPVKVSREVQAEITPLLHRGAGRVVKSKQARLHSKLMAEADKPKEAANKSGGENQELAAEKECKAKRRSEKEFLRDEERVARLHATGLTKAEIGESLGLTECQVNEHYENLATYFKKLAATSAQELRGRQLARLDMLWGECVEGIKESKKPAKKRTVEALRGIGGGPAPGRSGKVVEITQGRIVDFGIMQIATNVLTREAKLMGLDAPVEVKQVYEEREQGIKDVLAAVARVATPEQQEKIWDELAIIANGDNEETE